MSDWSDAVGVVVLINSLGIGVFSLGLLVRNARLLPLRSAFAQITLVPTRRRRFMILVWVEVLCFLSTGILFGLYNLGIQLEADSDLPFTVSFLAGMVTLGALAWVGLRTRPLTAEERADVERDVPTILESLWMIPFQNSENPPPRPPRT
ncbi:MAG TPA: hypothetical protein VK424_07190 [Thermoplasmata archaeon]|nr:hypothetical protein [Thermoplasmata archaeon]